MAERKLLRAPFRCPSYFTRRPCCDVHDGHDLIVCPPWICCRKQPRHRSFAAPRPGGGGAYCVSDRRDSRNAQAIDLVLTRHCPQRH